MTDFYDDDYDDLDTDSDEEVDGGDGDGDDSGNGESWERAPRRTDRSGNTPPNTRKPPATGLQHPLTIHNYVQVQPQLTPFLLSDFQHRIPSAIITNTIFFLNIA